MHALDRELASMQAQNGLCLVTVADNAIQLPGFSKGIVQLKTLPNGAGVGEISRDGTMVAFSFSRGVQEPARLAISRTDGTGFREYPNLQNVAHICWSPDNSKLVLTAIKNNDAHTSQLVFDLKSGRAEPLEDGAGLVTSQCWSPDGTELVYDKVGTIRVYDVVTKRSRELEQGENPTWSPDGSRIAFRDRDRYYSIHPSGSRKQVLFKKRHLHSALWWSPDSRFVAYVSQAGLLEGGFSLDVETYFVRVRRMSDSSETSVNGSYGAASYQWVVNPELVKLSQASGSGI
jgi:Tol biopolymer transport system component